MIDKVTATSVNIGNENLEKLRKVFPQVVKDGEVDFDALKKFFDTEGISAGEEKYGLSWAGKSNAFKAIRTAATGTLAPQPEESKNWDSTDNIFIEGDNLEVLKLLQKHYREKIKMIYIDPPYNTGRDFVYKDNFTQSVADYYEQTGQTEGGIKMTANTEKNGRYHSDWLTMMYPRLFLAKNLLREDGVIFVSIDDNEVANLRLIMDEIFGEENLVGQFIWEKKYTTSNNIKGISYTHEYILSYVKNFQLIDNAINRYQYSDEARSRFKNLDNDPRGEWSDMSYHGPKSPSERPNLNYPLNHPVTNEEIWPKEKSWAYEKKQYLRHVAENRLWWGKNGSYKEPRLKVYLSEIQGGIIPKSFLNYEDFGTTSEGRADLRDVLGKNDDGALFDNPKPVRLLKKLIEIGAMNNSLILDFFAGSGTTAHAVIDLNAKDSGNRKFICVQLPEVTDESSEAYKAGYKTITEISRERIRRAGEEIGKGDVGFKSFVLQKSNYSEWNILTDKDDEERLKKQAQLFIEQPLVSGYDEQSVVYEILVKEGFNVNASVVQGTDDLKSWLVSDGDKRLIVTFADIVTKEHVESLGLKPEDILICFDSALDDTTKVNLSRSVTLKVI